MHDLAPALMDTGGVDQGIVRISGLSKRFPVQRSWRELLTRPTNTRWATVLHDIHCAVQAGEFVGLLGPNGAGKTTLLKVISTLVIPDAGTVTVAGHDVVNDAAAARASVASCLANERSLYFRLTSRENLSVAAALQGVASGECASRIEEVLVAVGMAAEEHRTKMVGQYSSGMMQRLLIARALLSRPRLLLLDEPTRSLDPISARDFRRFLRKELVDARGCSVVLATHNAEEAFDLCDRVAVMDRGRLLAMGAADELASRYHGTRYKIRTSEPDHSALAELERGGRILKVGLDRGGPLPSITVRLNGGAGDSEAILRHLILAGLPVASFERVELNLAELIEGVVSANAESFA